MAIRPLRKALWTGVMMSNGTTMVFPLAFLQACNPYCLPQE
jgi:hypothetical protein